MGKFNATTFNAEVFGAYVSRIPKVKKNEMLQCGILQRNSEIRGAFHAKTGTAYATLPMYGQISGAPLNYDGQTDITADSLSSFERKVIVVGRAKAWTEHDFAEDITGGAKFMDNVARQIASYWDDVDQGVLLSILKGIFSMSGTANEVFVKAHTLDISAETGEAGVLGAATLNTAVQQAGGDNKNKYSVVIMHSAVAAGLENLNLLSYLKQTDSRGIERDLSLATWNGRMVLVDDSMPVEGNGNNAKYTTYILGKGAFDYEDIGAKIPFEMFRDPKTNGGMDTLFSRQRKCFAPYGISYTKNVQASLSPTDEELENGENWELVHDGGSPKTVIDHKAIPIARIISRC